MSCWTEFEWTDHHCLNNVRIGEAGSESASGGLSPLAHTIVTALGNGSAGSGYIPTEEAFNRYTFQVLGSRLKPGCAEDAVVNAAVGLLTEGAR